MRRWRFWHRLSRDARPHDRDRCILVVEQLEGREVLSPMVVAPSQVQTFEDIAYTFNGSGAFFVFENGSGNFGQPYTAALTAANGTLSVDLSTATNLGVTVTNNGTSTVTLSGRVENLTSLLIDPGLTFTPTGFYGGDALVGVTLTDTSSGKSNTGSTPVRVSPVASNASISVNSSGEVWAPASGFDFPAGFVTVQSWNDADGSERVTLTLAVEADDPSALFTLYSNGVEISSPEPNLWQLSGTDPAAFQALLDSLVLVPPAGFSGRAFINVFGNVRDVATFSSAPNTESAFRDLGFGYADLRFFQGGSVTTPTAFAQEGGTIDLGGRFVATDPDDLPGDTHTLTLSVPSGALAFDPAAVPSGLSVNQSGNTITLNGPLDAINAFLAAPGSLTYAPSDAHFAGVVPLTITLTNHPGAFSEMPGMPAAQTDAPGAFTGVAALVFVPVAEQVFPSATDVTTNQDTPVVLTIGLSALADIDGSESVLIVLDGVPAGASFDHGTDLGSGQWAFAPADLPGLTFTPPPGATGAFAMTVKVIVTDSASGLPADVETASTAFTVTVLPFVPSLPDDDDDPIDDEESDFAEPVVVDTSLEDTVSDDDEDEELPRPANANAVVFVNAYSSSGPELQFGPTETHVSLAPPAQGSLFAQAEVPLPIYGDGERHPLPPVLPLDQTLPVAGFTESGGDSIALVDKLYRDAAVPSPGTPVSLVSPETPTEKPERVTHAQTTVTPAPPSTGAPDTVTAAPLLAEEDAGGEWRVWAATTAIAGSLAAWVWLSRGTDGFFARAVRRFFRAAHRRPTERTA